MGAPFAIGAAAPAFEVRSRHMRDKAYENTGNKFAAFVDNVRMKPWREKRADAEADVAALLRNFRPCIRCRRHFHSEGIHNRLCTSCGRETASMA